MPLNGTGTYTAPSPEFPAVANTTILASDFNTIILDIAAALSMALYNDGQQPWTGDQAAATKALSNIGALTGKTAGMVVSAIASLAGIAAGMPLTNVNGIAAVAGGSALTGGPWTATTQPPGDASTKLATTAYADAIQTLITAALALKAPLASPALTGVPTAPTAAVGTNTTQIATMAALLTQAFTAALPLQSGNSGKIVTTNGTTASWSVIGSANQILQVDPTGTFLQGVALPTSPDFLLMNLGVI